MSKTLKRGVLNARNSLSDPDLIAKYRALYAGGVHFHREIDRFFCPNPNEPPSLAKDRKKELFYTNHVGPIADFFASMLFAAPHNIRSIDAKTKEPVEVDAFYAEFADDIDGGGEALPDFYRARFTEALVAGTAWIRARLPEATQAPASKVEYEEQGLGDATLQPILSENVLDWETDETGGLLWAVIYDCKCPRPSPDKPRKEITETWTILDNEKESVYQLTYDPDKTKPDDETDIPLVAEIPHRFPRVPLICIRPRESLWLMNRVADIQVEHFKIENGLNWAIRRTCYPTPVFKLADPDVPPKMGQGSYIVIGKDDDFTFTSSGPAPFDVISNRLDGIRDNIYRVTRQMAAGVNNNAAAVGRSADSKAQDAAATHVVLLAYADLVKDAIEETMELISDARGDIDVTFSVEGLDLFDDSATAALVNTAKVAKDLAIPSDTFKREMAKRVAQQLLPDLPQDVQDKIRDEIETADLNPPLAVMPVPGDNDAGDQVSPNDGSEPPSSEPTD